MSFLLFDRKQVQIPLTPGTTDQDHRGGPQSCHTMFSKRDCAFSRLRFFYIAPIIAQEKIDVNRVENAPSLHLD